MKLPGRSAAAGTGQIRVENLINAAETGGGWLMFARIGVMRASDTGMEKARVTSGLKGQPTWTRPVYFSEVSDPRTELCLSAGRSHGAVEHDSKCDTESRSGSIRWRRDGFVIQEF